MKPLLKIPLIALASVATIPFVILFLIIALQLAPNLFGYYSTLHGSDVARIAAKENNPLECKKILRLFDFLGISNSEHRRICFYEAAQLMQDPSVCENLMPSQYAVQCISNTLMKARLGDSCASTQRKKEMYCDRISEAEGPAWLTQETCKTEKDPIRKTWCTVANAAWNNDFDACEQLENGAKDRFRDDCFMKKGNYLHDQTSCDRIEHEVIRNACTTFIYLWKTYPQTWNEAFL